VQIDSSKMQDVIAKYAKDFFLQNPQFNISFLLAIHSFTSCHLW